MGFGVASSQPSVQVNTNPSKIYVEPRQWDVLCGKSKRCVDHDGSRRFRAVIECHRDLYQQALTKFDKTSVTRNIYDALCQAGSRFLKHDEKADIWEEVSPMAARDKIGHALRFANRVSRKKPSQAPEAIVSAVSSVGSSYNVSIGIVASHGDCASMKLPFPSLDMEPIPIRPVSSSSPAATWPTSLTASCSSEGSHQTQMQMAQQTDHSFILEPTPLEELISQDATRRQTSSLSFLNSSTLNKPLASTAFLPTSLHESFAFMNGAFMESAVDADTHESTCGSGSGGHLFFGQGDLPADFDFDTEISSVLF